MLIKTAAASHWIAGGAGILGGLLSGYGLAKRHFRRKQEAKEHEFMSEYERRKSMSKLFGNNPDSSTNEGKRHKKNITIIND